MDWEQLKTISRFTPLDDIFNHLGAPKFRLGTRRNYNMGSGYFITFTERRFYIDQANQRVEIGESGEYALGCCYFKNIEFSKIHFGLDTNEVEKLQQEVYEDENIKIMDEVSTDDTYQQVSSILCTKSGGDFYREGENRALINGSFKFAYNFIRCGNYELYFYGRSKKTEMGGFMLTFFEDVVSSVK